MLTVELTSRQRVLLRLIIQEYIQSALPVGSKSIFEHYHISVSPATIRNEMAILEEEGYLTHPHTSAGRVPTGAGYRYFVQELMGEGNLSPQEQRMIRHQFHQARMDLDQWMHLSAAVLARTTSGASLITAPKAEQSHLKYLELLSIREGVALLILVLQEGIVKQQILAMDVPMTQEELSPVSRRLTDIWCGLDASGIQQIFSLLNDFEMQIALIVIEAMELIDNLGNTEIYHDGLMNILQQPESASGELMTRIIRALEERQIVERMIDETMQSDGVQIIIGGEGKWQDLSEISIVLTRYGVQDKISGALGVLGPLRMPYGRAVSIVRYMSHLMSDFVTDLYGL